MRNRTDTVEKTAKLLEHFLLVHHDPMANKTIATRKEICDFTGWTFKTASKALDLLRETGLWEIKEFDRHIEFAPLFPDESIAPESLKAHELSELVWANSSLSGTALMIALALSRVWDRDTGLAEVSLTELSRFTGRTTNTVSDNIKVIEDSGEWEKVSIGHSNCFRPNLDLLSVDHSDVRHSTREGKVNNPGNLIPGNKKESFSHLPFMLDDLDKMHGRAIRPFTRRRSFEGYAKRLMDDTDLSTRKSKRSFTLPNLTRLYEELAEHANIEIVDTLMHYQCATGGALDLRFLRPVAQRLSKSWKTKPPARFSKESETSGAYVTAMAVWKIISARQTLPPKTNTPIEADHSKTLGENQSDNPYQLP